MENKRAGIEQESGVPPKPADATWTDDQWAAIAVRGADLLVAAAAGSGKTAVLVERIIRRITDERDPLDVDRLLVATFTNAAAAEMRHRIREALEKELLRQPSSAHLRRQLALMGRASITTLHSFCLEVVRRYEQLAGLAPGFRIANETEAELLRQDVLEEMLERHYAAAEEGGLFWRTADAFGGEKSDAGFHALIQKLYDEARSHPYPEHWLRSAANRFGPRPAGSEAAVGRGAVATVAVEAAKDAEAGILGAVEASKDAGLGMAGAIERQSDAWDGVQDESNAPPDPEFGRMDGRAALTEAGGLVESAAPADAGAGKAVAELEAGLAEAAAASVVAEESAALAARAEQAPDWPLELPSLALWQQSLLGDMKLELEGAGALLQQAIDTAEAPGGPYPYAGTLRDDLSVVSQLLDAAGSGWEALVGAFGAVSFGKLKPCKGDDIDKELQEHVKELRGQAKDQVSRLQEELFGRTPEQFALELAALAPIVHTLVDLVVEFGEMYSQAKESKGLVDFGDLEHCCLRVLRDPQSTPERLLPSAAAHAYREQFAEVLLDEYQDTNRVQEAIVTLISRSAPGNRFMVGDVKQSIYRFRLAEPGLFLEKYQSFTATGAGPGRRIDLARNFRSRKEVVRAVNFVFTQTMHGAVGEIDYDERAELVYGAGYAEPEGAEWPVEALLLEKAEGAAPSGGDAGGESEGDFSGEAADAGEQDEKLELETAQLEARAVAVRVQELLGAGGRPPMQVYDKSLKAFRDVSYRDIVILLRATQQWAPVFIEELKLYGVPAYAELSTGYFAATEVEVVMSLLHVIDNPYQDIPLAAVLRSPIVRLTAEEMAQLRLADRSGSFYEAVRQYARGDKDDAQWAAAGGGEMAASSAVPDIGRTKVTAEAEPENGEAAESNSAADEGETAVFSAVTGIGMPMTAADDEDAAPIAAGNIQENGGNASLRRRVRRFLAKLEEWRKEARQGALPELIWRLYRETGYFDFVGGLPGGQQRQANLRALYDRARQYESTSLRGLFRFLRFLERMRDSGGDLGTARALGEQENVVRIMSIHKSKGLEFPVVFVAGLGKMFNRSDANEPFVTHKELGFGPRYVDAELRAGYPTLPALAIQRRMKRELLAEEMRVLYVALTRAREKLILLGTAPSAEKLLRKWSRTLEQPERKLPEHELAKARCYLDWIGPALLRHPQAQRGATVSAGAAGCRAGLSKKRHNGTLPSSRPRRCALRPASKERCRTRS
ncbi:UvrD-helicase domain-containing protein [Gordoniibacillus kamchatkensis]|uniref:UvrD-helicase domain-containing protein n=1 Tax=Gordoniibacillus kamchatkensis TaxID=1590651 RepID=UPI001E4C8A27|nr:UvrD-helicase domain-containing protein [Paenibacillus sp. VKM B-2647]